MATKPNPTAISLFTLCLLVAVPLPVLAEPLGLNDFLDLSLEELSKTVIESASEFDDSLLAVASSVTHLSERQWQRTGARKAKETLGHMASVQVATQILGSQTIHIRGFTTTSPRGHSTLLDNVPINSFAFNTSSYHFNDINLIGLQSIELIRGPVAVQYGSDAFHGAVSLQSYSGDRDLTQIRGSAATNGFYNAGLRHSSQFDSHYLDINFGLLTQNDQDIAFDWTDANTDQSGSGRWGNEDESYQGIAKWGRRDNEGISYELGLYLNTQERQDYPGYGRFFGTTLKERNLYDVDTDFQMLRVALGDKLTNDIDVNLQVFYWQSSIEDHRWFTYEEQRNWSKDEYRSGAKLTFKQENRKLHTRWSLSFEGDYAKITKATALSTDAAENIINFVDENYEGFSRRINTVAAQATTTVFDEHLQLHYGLRYDDFAAFSGHYSPRLGVVYLPKNHNAFKLLYGKGFRATSAGERGGFGNAIKGNLDLDPETIDTYEAVYLYQSPVWQGELVFFHSDWKDSISNVPSNDPDFSREFVNEGENESRGMEASLHFDDKQFSADVSASFVDSRIVSNNVDYVAFPRWIFNLGVGYHLPQHWTEIYFSNRIEDGAHENLSPDSRELKIFWQSDLHIAIRQGHDLLWKLDFRNLFDLDNELPSKFSIEDGLPGETFSVLLGFEYGL